MAQKRMFDKTITNSDEFIDMPDSAQNLYFHLSMNADDDGFINNWKNIMRMTGHKEDDIKILIAKQYVIPFDSGVIVIRHWRINNYLRGDRYIETKYKAEKQQLQLDENMVYQLATTGIPAGLPSGNPVKNSIDKNSIDENSIDKGSMRGETKGSPRAKFIPPTLGDIQEYIASKKLNVDAEQFYDYFDTGGWVDSKGNKVKNWKQKLLTWNKYNLTSTNQPKKQRYTFADLLEEEYGNDKKGNGWDTGSNADSISTLLPDTIPRGYQESS